MIVFPDLVSSERPIHVLLVDEDEQHVDGVRIALELAGLQVSVADLPDIGLVRRVLPDIVVLALSFRGAVEGSLEFLERQASDPRTRALPVIALHPSSALSQEEESRVENLGCMVLPYSTRPETLLAKIDTCLGRTRVPAGADSRVRAS